MKHVLFPFAELTPGKPRSVAIGRTQVLVVKTSEGELRALADRCPHRGARLSVLGLEPMMVADDVGQYRATDEYIVRCPWHGYEFSIESGRCPADPEQVRVKCFSVSTSDGMVVLEMGSGGGDSQQAT